MGAAHCGRHKLGDIHQPRLASIVASKSRLGILSRLFKLKCPMIHFGK